MRLILYLNTDWLKVYRVSREGLEKLNGFRTNSTGQAEFSAFLQKMPSIPCQLLTDLIEEEFREVNLPHARGRDRRALHERHRARLFRTTAFRSSCYIGRQRSGRRDDRVLFSALTNPDLLRVWIDILERHHMPLQGIISLPILSRRLLKPLGAGNTCLLVTQQGDHSLRESFIKNGRLHFSRLAPLSDNSTDAFGRTLIAEAEKTHRYLLSLKLLAQDESLELFIINEIERLKIAQRQCPDQDKMHFHFHDIAQLAAQIGCTDYPSGADSEALFVHLQLKSGPANHYAQTEHRQHYFALQWRKALKMATLLTGASGLLWSGLNLADGLLLTHQAERLQPLLSSSETRFLTAKKDLPQNSVDAAHMVSAIDLATRIDHRRGNPRILMQLIGRVLMRAPDLALDNLDWASTSKLELGSDKDSRDNQPAPELQGMRYAIATVSGHIRNFDGNYVRAEQRLRQLATRLAAQPGVTRAELIKQPLNSASNTHLEGVVGSLARENAAPFVLRIVMAVNQP